ncbi:uncharacterized protein K452DRAFT_303486 [Aplosporella prunicola CBS 121167]|uniref:Uncharacterized protein n=1 Tax=Aplosporella prunicola CBS 121167 TaxID=1176127 RepID=A0A6A6AU97_9PEZI|nr:uncharacterized protein K452DRAFT_303486 [Aplosporella prunicola CBS 121167]KAF2135529.1 hypothetical protein K452DRAFT_303486 [Aplosporella prunicola CBS 121167]
MPVHVTPVVYRAFNMILELRQRTWTEADLWKTIDLTRDEYDVFWELLHEDRGLWEWTGANLQVDYDLALLTIRAPHRKYKLFATMVARSISAQVHSHSPFNSKIADICYRTPELIWFKQPRFAAPNSSQGGGYRCPDVVFKPVLNGYPTVVIEVCNATKKDYMAVLAQDYWQGRDGRVMASVFLCLENKFDNKIEFSKKASVVVFHFGGQGPVPSPERCFRDHEGRPVQGNLTLKLVDFSGSIPVKLHDRLIQIPFSELCENLAIVESLNEATPENRGGVESNHDRKGKDTNVSDNTASDLTGRALPNTTVNATAQPYGDNRQPQTKTVMDAFTDMLRGQRSSKTMATREPMGCPLLETAQQDNTVAAGFNTHGGMNQQQTGHQPSPFVSITEPDPSNQGPPEMTQTLPMDKNRRRDTTQAGTHSQTLRDRTQEEEDVISTTGSFQLNFSTENPTSSQPERDEPQP